MNIAKEKVLTGEAYLRHNFPELWKKLRDLDARTWRQYRPDYSISDLDVKFTAEDEYEKMQIRLFVES